MTTLALALNALAAAWLYAPGGHAAVAGGTGWAALIRLLRSVLLVLLMALSPGDPVAGEMSGIGPEIHQILRGDVGPVLERRLAETGRAIGSTIERLLR